MSILSTYGGQQRRIRVERCTSQQLPSLISALEDARFTNQDIYILYINFKNTFGFIDHARLLAIMEDLGYVHDVVALVGNIYSQSTTTYIG